MSGDTETGSENDSAYPAWLERRDGRSEIDQSAQPVLKLSAEPGSSIQRRVETSSVFDILPVKRVLFGSRSLSVVCRAFAEQRNTHSDAAGKVASLFQTTPVALVLLLVCAFGFRGTPKPLRASLIRATTGPDRRQGDRVLCRQRT